MNHPNITLAIVTVASLAALGWSYANSRGTKVEAPVEAGHAETEQHNEEGASEAQGAIIGADALKANNISIETANQHTIRETLRLSGRVILNPDTRADIKARYPGIVRRVAKDIGAPVAKGETLASVESNDSLQTYAITSPIKGVVVSRQASVGDAANDQALFTVGDLDGLVAEFHVFSSDAARVAEGQSIVVRSVDGSLDASGTIAAVLPTADAETQTVQTRVKLANPEGGWKPGMAVQGDVVTGEVDVPVAVKASALQTMENQSVLFAVSGQNNFEKRPVKVGRRDDTWAEITEGLKSGERYVGANSFIVKAEIEKAGAEHEH